MNKELAETYTRKEKYMETSKEALAEKIYYELKMKCGNEFDSKNIHDEFIKTFQEVLENYELMPVITMNQLKLK